MSALKWSLLVLTVLLSSEICSAHRVRPVSEPFPADLPETAKRPPSPKMHTPVIPVRGHSAAQGLGLGLHSHDQYMAEDGPPPSPVRGWSGAQGPVPVDGPYSPWAQSPNTADGSITQSRPVMDGSDPSPARRVKPPPKASTEGEEGPVTPVTSGESDVNVNCGGGGWGQPGCGEAPCVAPPKNPYYCQPAGCVGSPPGYVCGAGGGFTIYLDDHFVPGKSPAGDEGKP